MDIRHIAGELNPYAKQKVQEGQRTKGGSSSNTASERGDKVQLSSEARLRGAALSEAGGTSDVRADKVRDLKERVRNGTYKPDIKKAAANLLRDDINLLT
ncbi:anti-sigma-28 factor, FlgM family [Paucidesulfovibrio gracilis DSM 16080]|uniref:Negative regulator of flagellin synthesis n=1 Tax=Paucidesulfovibrio gracilis DSM 16080 TaxID=1121449 RepID=A0A1T4XAH9_9BACT|nr:flagellar biosynthesis anti-sigma factor FlgM [Paucidesulfovibrio gracilis]SKA86600.1 anti-sigma-28 factor, FlgM family [Paucidesulfovibrio gracilis DSM 16080]